MIELKSRSELVWYAKGWHERNNMFWDLAILLSDIYMVDLMTITKNDIRQFMLNLCRDVGLFDNSHNFFDFMDSIAPEQYFRNIEGQGAIQYMYRPHPDYDFDTAVVGKCLRMLALVQITREDKILVKLEDLKCDLLRRKQK